GRNAQGGDARAVRDVRRRARQRARRASDFRRVRSESGLLRLARQSGPGPAPQPPAGSGSRIRGGSRPRAVAEFFSATAQTSDGYGEVAEWLNAAVSKTVIPLRVSGVRIPPSPP